MGLEIEGEMLYDILICNISSFMFLSSSSGLNMLFGTPNIGPDRHTDSGRTVYRFNLISAGRQRSFIILTVAFSSAGKSKSSYTTLHQHYNTG